MSVKEDIRGVVEGDPRVRFALLFGSRTRTTARADSDWDVAVYLDESMELSDRFRARAGLVARLEEIAPADVVVLNEADSLLAREALRGELIVCRDPARYVRFFTRVLALAEDQRYFDRILTAARARRLEEGNFGRP